MNNNDICDIIIKANTTRILDKYTEFYIYLCFKYLNTTDDLHISIKNYFDNIFYQTKIGKNDGIYNNIILSSFGYGILILISVTSSLFIIKHQVKFPAQSKHMKRQWSFTENVSISNDVNFSP